METTEGEIKDIVQQQMEKSNLYQALLSDKSKEITDPRMSAKRALDFELGFGANPDRRQETLHAMGTTLQHELYENRAKLDQGAMANIAAKAFERVAEPEHVKETASIMDKVRNTYEQLIRVHDPNKEMVGKLIEQELSNKNQNQLIAMK